MERELPLALTQSSDNNSSACQVLVALRSAPAVHLNAVIISRSAKLLLSARSGNTTQQFLSLFLLWQLNHCLYTELKVACAEFTSATYLAMEDHLGPSEISYFHPQLLHWTQTLAFTKSLIPELKELLIPRWADLPTTCALDFTGEKNPSSVDIW